MTDWAKLLSDDRCKAYGIPWTEEEMIAIRISGIPALYVRQGILTKEDYEKALSKSIQATEKDNKVALLSLKREELMVLCKKYKINVSEEAIRPSMIEQLLLVGAPKRISLEWLEEKEAEKGKE